MFLFNSIDGYFLNGWLILKTTHASNGSTQALFKLDNMHGAFHFFYKLKKLHKFFGPHIIIYYADAMSPTYKYDVVSILWT